MSPELNGISRTMSLWAAKACPANKQRTKNFAIFIASLDLFIYKKETKIKYLSKFKRKYVLLTCEANGYLWMTAPFKQVVF